jgi:hypothetical protein
VDDLHSGWTTIWLLDGPADWRTGWFLPETKDGLIVYGRRQTADGCWLLTTGVEMDSVDALDG